MVRAWWAHGGRGGRGVVWRVLSFPGGVSSDPDRKLHHMYLTSTCTYAARMGTCGTSGRTGAGSTHAPGISQAPRVVSTCTASVQWQ